MSGCAPNSCFSYPWKLGSSKINRTDFGSKTVLSSFQNGASKGKTKSSKDLLIGTDQKLFGDGLETQSAALSTLFCFYSTLPWTTQQNWQCPRSSDKFTSSWKWRESFWIESSGQSSLRNCLFRRWPTEIETWDWFCSNGSSWQTHLWYRHSATQCQWLRRTIWS